MEIGVEKTIIALIPARINSENSHETPLRFKVW